MLYVFKPPHICIANELQIIYSIFPFFDTYLSFFVLLFLSFQVSHTYKDTHALAILPVSDERCVGDVGGCVGEHCRVRWVQVIIFFTNCYKKYNTFIMNQNYYGRR